MAIPAGIEVIHTPDKVSAIEGGRSGHRFTWLHKTSVRSTVGDLTVVEFGAFVDLRGKWEFSTYTGKPFTTADFADWYSCPNAKLIDSQNFTDPQNWTGADALHESSGLWYYIGEDSSGKRFRGVARVDTLAQIKSEQAAAGQLPADQETKD
jgi:hypothetical protein